MSTTWKDAGFLVIKGPEGHSCPNSNDALFALGCGKWQHGGALSLLLPLFEVLFKDVAACRPEVSTHTIELREKGSFGIPWSCLTGKSWKDVRSTKRAQVSHRTVVCEYTRSFLRKKSHCDITLEEEGSKHRCLNFNLRFALSWTVNNGYQVCVQ